MKKLNNKKGFTIVELVIVIAVIGILGAVLIPTFAGITGSAKKSASLQETRNTLSEYITQNDGADAGLMFFYPYTEGDKNYYDCYLYANGKLNFTGIWEKDSTNFKKDDSFSGTMEISSDKNTFSYSNVELGSYIFSGTVNVSSLRAGYGSALICKESHCTQICKDNSVKLTETLEYCKSDAAGYANKKAALTITYTVIDKNLYTLPDTIEVKVGDTDLKAGTNYTWDKGNGKLIINEGVITDEVTITVTATQKSGS